MANTAQSADWLWQLLKEVELEQFYARIRDSLLIRQLEHFEYVKVSDLERIGVSKPAARRLLDAVKKRKAGQKRKVGMISKMMGRTGTGGTAAAEVKQEEFSATAFTCLIPDRDIRLISHLGDGTFGVVMRGEWTQANGTNKLPVAVKILKNCEASGLDQASYERLLSALSSNAVAGGAGGGVGAGANDDAALAFTDFVREVNALHVLRHTNLIRLHGVVLGTRLMMVTELARFGSLLEVLRRGSATQNTNAFSLTSSNSEFHAPLTVDRLWSFALQIGEGMSYLESQRCVHRDLALRNVLVCDAEHVRIGDFGLTRFVAPTDEHYTMSEHRRVPFAWCAPESLRTRRFSHASDTWSLGVALWELFSAGAEPWLGLPGCDVLERLDSGRRLPFPRAPSDQPAVADAQTQDGFFPARSHCPPQLYRLMLQCWLVEPERRPSFAAVVEFLRDQRPFAAECCEASDAAADTRKVSWDPSVPMRLAQPSAASLSLRLNDELVVFDSPPEALWYGLQLRTGLQGYFPQRAVRARGGRALPPAVRVSAPIPGSLMHTGHGDIRPKDSWGNPARIDELYLTPTEVPRRASPNSPPGWSCETAQFEPLRLPDRTRKWLQLGPAGVQPSNPDRDTSKLPPARPPPVKFIKDARFADDTLSFARTKQTGDGPRLIDLDTPTSDAPPPTASIPRAQSFPDDIHLLDLPLNTHSDVLSLAADVQALSSVTTSQPQPQPQPASSLYTNVGGFGLAPAEPMSTFEYTPSSSNNPFVRALHDANALAPSEPVTRNSNNPFATGVVQSQPLYTNVPDLHAQPALAAPAYTNVPLVQPTYVNFGAVAARNDKYAAIASLDSAFDPSRSLFSESPARTAFGTNWTANASLLPAYTNLPCVNSTPVAPLTLMPAPEPAPVMSVTHPNAFNWLNSQLSSLGLFASETSAAPAKPTGPPLPGLAILQPVLAPVASTSSPASTGMAKVTSAAVLAEFEPAAVAVARCDTSSKTDTNASRIELNGKKPSDANYWLNGSAPLPLPTQSQPQTQTQQQPQIQIPPGFTSRPALVQNQQRVALPQPAPLPSKMVDIPAPTNVVRPKQIVHDSPARAVSGAGAGQKSARTAEPAIAQYAYATQACNPPPGAPVGKLIELPGPRPSPGPAAANAASAAVKTAHVKPFSVQPPQTVGQKASVDVKKGGMGMQERIYTLTNEVHGVTEEEAAAALTQFDFNVVEARKFLSVEQLFRLGITTKEQCRKLLEKLNWNLEVAGSILMEEAKRGRTNQPTSSRS